MRPTNGRVHDRYVVLDHGQPEEEIYHCGSSSKDAGNKITTIMKVESPKDYASFIDALR